MQLSLLATYKLPVECLLPSITYVKLGDGSLHSAGGGGGGGPPPSSLHAGHGLHLPGFAPIDSVAATNIPAISITKTTVILLMFTPTLAFVRSNTDQESRPMGSPIVINNPPDIYTQATFLDRLSDILVGNGLAWRQTRP